MKANDAPEKHYLNIDGDGIHYYTEGTPCEREYIEYIRTDVFVNKACEWLEPVFKNLAGHYSGSELLDDFKNYMKGE